MWPRYSVMASEPVVEFYSNPYGADWFSYVVFPAAPAVTSTKYEVQPMSGDAARPYAVVAAFRSYNRVIARYATEKQAKRRARALNYVGFGS